MVTDTAPTGAFNFTCQGPTADTSCTATTISEAASFCGPGNQLRAGIHAPDCWDGKRLDSPNHRDHVAYSGYGEWGYLRCSATHPYIIPTFTMGAWYSVTADAPASNWYLSSDDMGDHRMPAGSTFHADWFGAWDDATLAAAIANCINRLLSCVDGDLGDGRQMIPPCRSRIAPVPARCQCRRGPYLRLSWSRAQQVAIDRDETVLHLHRHVGANHDAYFAPGKGSDQGVCSDSRMRSRMPLNFGLTCPEG
jgi:hypothetical protein